MTSELIGCVNEGWGMGATSEREHASNPPGYSLVLRMNTSRI
jgi:hypothetical protein